MQRKFLFVIFLLIVVMNAPTFAAVPGLMNYEGKLTNQYGTAETGSFTMKFAIYDAATVGSKVWPSAVTEDHTVTVNDGIFNVVLGDGATPITPSVFSGEPRYLEIIIGSDTLSPRTRIVSVGYAMKASSAESAATLSTAYVTGVSSAGAAAITGAAHLKPGSNVILTQTGSTIEIAATGGAGGVTRIDASRGLLGGSIITTGVLTIDTNVVITTLDAQTLSSKTIDASSNTIKNIGNSSISDSAINEPKLDVTNSPVSGQVLSYQSANQFTWISAGGTGTVQSIGAGRGLTTTGSNPITASGVLTIDASVVATVDVSGRVLDSNKLAGATWAAPLGIGTGTASTGAFSTLNVTGTLTAGAYSGKVITGVSSSGAAVLTGEVTLKGSGDTKITQLGNEITITSVASTGSGGTVTQVNTGKGLTGGPFSDTGTISIDSTVVTTSDSQALSGKTINASNNTITNIGSAEIANGQIFDAEINANAAIVDTKLATISTAGKVSGGAITSGTIGGSTIINTSGDIKTTGVLTAGAYSGKVITGVSSSGATVLTGEVVFKGSGDAKITQNGNEITITSVASLGSGGTVTSVGSGYGLTGGPISNTGTLTIDATVVATVDGTGRVLDSNKLNGQLASYYATASSVTAKADQSALNAHTVEARAVHGLSAGSAVVGTSESQTLTGKTISGSSNTLSNIPGGAIVSGTVTSGALATNINITGTLTAGAYSGKVITGVSSSGATVLTGEVVFKGSGDAKITQNGNEITITSVASTGSGGTVTQVNTGKGLTGGPFSDTGTISIDATVVTTSDAQILTNKTLTATGNSIDATAITVGTLNNARLPSNINIGGTITAAAYSGKVITGVSSSGATVLTGEVTLVPGSNVTMTQSENNITIGSVAAGGGTVTSVGSGRGLTGGPIANTGTLTIDTNVVVTTIDAQVLSSKTINSTNSIDATAIKVGTLAATRLDGAYNITVTGATTADTANTATNASQLGGQGASYYATSSNLNTHTVEVTGAHGLGAGSAVVGTSDAQTLTNKTINSANNTLTGVVTGVSSQGSSAIAGKVDLKPGANITLNQSGQTIEIVASGGSGSVTQIDASRGLLGGSITNTGTLTIDTNVVVTTSDAQALSNKTLNSTNSIDATAIKVGKLDNARLPSDINVSGIVTAAAYSGKVITGVSSSGATVLTGEVTFSPGTNVTLTQSGQNIIIAAASGSGTVTSIGAGHGLTTETNPITGSGVLTIDASVVATVDGSGRVLDSSKLAGATWAAPLGIGTGTASTGAFSTLNISGYVTGAAFSGDGSKLTALNGAAITSGTVTGGALATNININTTGVVTAAAVFGTFEGTYTAEYEKGVAFLYPYATSEVTIRLPYNATITSVEVYCTGGTSVNGAVQNNAANVGNATANVGAWAVGAIANTAYTKNNNIRFYTPTVTGAVNSATVLIRYQRLP